MRQKKLLRTFEERRQIRVKNYRRARAGQLKRSTLRKRNETLKQRRQVYLAPSQPNYEPSRAGRGAWENQHKDTAPQPIPAPLGPFPGSFILGSIIRKSFSRASFSAALTSAAFAPHSCLTLSPSSLCTHFHAHILLPARLLLGLPLTPVSLGVPALVSALFGLGNPSGLLLFGRRVRRSGYLAAKVKNTNMQTTTTGGGAAKDQPVARYLWVSSRKGYERLTMKPSSRIFEL